jgi:hypothetical protein
MPRGKSGPTPPFDHGAYESLQFPTTQEGWELLPEIDEGRDTFKASSLEANKVDELFETKRVPLSVKPGHLRKACPFLHRYNSKSFASWFYKWRSGKKIGDTLNTDKPKAIAPIAPTKEPLPKTAPANISPANSGTGVPKEIMPFDSRTIATNNKREISNMLAEEVEFVAEQEELTKVKAIEVVLPTFISVWQNTDLQWIITVSIWVLSGAYHWKYTQFEDFAIFKWTLARTITHSALAAPFPRDKNFETRKIAIKNALMASKDPAATTTWFYTCIDFPRAADLTEDPEVSFIEMPNTYEYLGEQFKGYTRAAYERLAVFDVKTPTKVVSDKKKIKKAMTYFGSDDEESLGFDV